jgi:uncharacterized membrane protein
VTAHLLAAISFSFAALDAPSALSPEVIATYSAGSAILLLGLIVAFRNEIPRARGLDKIVCLGPVLFAAPLAVFGAEHFTVTRDIAGIVPRWIPWHMFWAIFVGIALLAAVLSLVVRRVAGLAATLLGIMFFCFVLLMGLPGLASRPADRFAQALTVRELSFSMCAFAFASTLANDRWRVAGQRIATAARYIVGAVVIFYGVEQLLHPDHVPVIPLELAMPAWLPLHGLWAYGTGAVMIAAGLAMLANWRARTATTILGIVVCVVVAFVYLPILAANPADIGVGMNYFADTLFFGGAVLMLAGSIPPHVGKPSAVAEPDRSVQLQ